MLYQPLLSGVVPYVINEFGNNTFPENMHHELEFLYCTKGEYLIKINNEQITLKSGYLALIGSMIPHEILKADLNATAMLLEIGPIFLGEKFKYFSDITYKLINTKHEHKIKSTLDELYEACHTQRPETYFITIGNLYKLSGYLFEKSKISKTVFESKSIKAMQEIEKVLELVYYHYTEPISIDDASKLCGYGKSNFCKIFKNIMGVSFHAYLNNFRIKNAEYLLLNTTLAIEEIAVKVGFLDAKTFCRVFKNIYGITAGQYRKSNKT